MQTSINQAGQPVGVAGQLSDNMEGMDIVSRFNQEASANIQFGIGIKPGAARDGVKLLTANTETVEGINIWGFNHEVGANGDLDQTAVTGGLRPKASMQVLQRGRCYVVVDAGVSSIIPNVDRGYIRCVANGGNTVIGAFSNISDSTNSIDSTKQVIFRSNIFTAADGVTKIAEVDVDFVNKP